MPAGDRSFRRVQESQAVQARDRGVAIEDRPDAEETRAVAGPAVEVRARPPEAARIPIPDENALLALFTAFAL